MNRAEAIVTRARSHLAKHRSRSLTSRMRFSAPVAVAFAIWRLDALITTAVSVPAKNKQDIISSKMGEETGPNWGTNHGKEGVVNLSQRCKSYWCCHEENWAVVILLGYCTYCNDLGLCVPGEVVADPSTPPKWPTYDCRPFWLTQTTTSCPLLAKYPNVPHKNSTTT